MLKFFTLLALSAITLSAQPISVGSVAPDFSLENIDGSTISLLDYSNENGVMVIFSYYPCTYVIAYKDASAVTVSYASNAVEALLQIKYARSSLNGCDRLLNSCKKLVF